MSVIVGFSWSLTNASEPKGILQQRTSLTLDALSIPTPIPRKKNDNNKKKNIETKHQTLSDNKINKSRSMHAQRFEFTSSVG